MSPRASVDFAPLFARWAGRVRRRLALRHALSGAAIGLAIAIVPAVVAWRAGRGAMRPYAALVGAAGAIGGLAVARRRRWSDVDVALYLDARLEGDEAIATAIALEPGAGDARAVVITRATDVLAKGDAKRARPRLTTRLQALAPIAIVALVLVARAPMPPAPARVEPPGAARVTIAQAEGLEKIAKLAQESARDDAQRERLDKIARDAQKLKDDLRAGMEKRDAQDRLARLREAIDQERLSLGDGERRAGLESAVGRLEQMPSTKGAARALGDHDLEAMDAEMEKLANAREAKDRAEAEKALDEAAESAKKAGAPDVAKALEDEKRLLKDRGARADALRDLAEAMKQSGAGDPEVGRQLDSLNREASDADARALAKAMKDALDKLTPEERARLAKKLAQMEKSGRVSSDPKALKDLQKELESNEGQERLEQDLKAMANEPTESEEAQRQEGLDEAQEGAEQTEDQVGGKPGGKGGGQAQGQAQGQGGMKKGHGGIPVPGMQAGGGDGQDGSGAGGTHDTGTGAHAGQTPVIAGDTLKSRAHGPINKAEAMPGGITTFAPGRAGGTANTRGTGDLRTVGPGEIEGIDKSDVPEEYREHVRQYFTP